MKVECNTGTHEYNKFQVCEVGDKEKGDHQQYWHDPNIGDFSIQYTTTPQGLAGPILRFKNINDWEPLVVDDIAKPKDESGAQVCYYGVDGKSLWWGCGIPKLGKQGLDGFESNVPVGPGGYATGTCQMHVVQHQKPDPSKDPYSLEVWIKDANQDDIGAVYPRVKMTNNQLEVASKLPRPVVFRTGAVDADPISISYADDKWDTNNENRCNVGAYDGGMRQLDCDFECK
ncbi:MAG: hypothetical protein LQ346_001460 [Caloplaca aetnensis]|nr:MAG: hypothetical protein LQ346_001460 [Caloplaca aetnensis]